MLIDNCGGILWFLLILRILLNLLDVKGVSFTCGCNHRSTNWDMGSVMLLQLDTIGLIPIGFLWIFFKKYSLDMRVCLGGLQNSNHACFRNPLFLNSLSLFVMLSFSVGDMSSSRGLYTVGSLRWSIAFVMYSFLSSTTIVEPLSALFITMRGFLIRSLSAILSFLVRLSLLFCLYLSVFSISDLIRCKNVSRVLLSDSLSGLKV